MRGRGAVFFFFFFSSFFFWWIGKTKQTKKKIEEEIQDLGQISSFVIVYYSCLEVSAAAALSRMPSMEAGYTKHCYI